MLGAISGMGVRIALVGMTILGLVHGCVPLNISPQPIRVTAALSYKDSNGSRPAIGIDTEIWRESGGWAMISAQQTDSNGSLDVSLPFTNTRATYALRIYARNYAAIVELSPAALLAEDAGQVKHQQAQGSGAVLNYDWTFTGNMAVGLNVVETLRVAKGFVQARRDSRETDVLRRTVVRTTALSSWYNPVEDAINLNPANFFDDYTIVHEYGHFVEEAVSSFVWVPSVHSGCNYEQLQQAFMEGFADWLAKAVTSLETVSPPWHTFSSNNTNTLLDLEDPVCKPRPPPSTYNDHHELYVAAGLWDLTDRANNESWDSMGGKDSEIIQILDHELDVYGSGPTLPKFRDAAVARGFDSNGSMKSIWDQLKLSWVVLN